MIDYHDVFRSELPEEDWAEYSAYLDGRLEEFLFDAANAELETVADYSL
jgi:hypothetical protein